ncbi:hypothetical protein Dsin_030041 [Dipteronia sinensis]|uniref:RNase H type-1 domain-containing protein n=1 Tax=Dipteronia sinensis TaxID=43782 RepID=A0AAD9ZIM0_9ROSI|nr:hypothetical protein Dsin_030041 [Dipteronia sinensis]
MMLRKKLLFDGVCTDQVNCWERAGELIKEFKDSGTVSIFLKRAYACGKGLAGESGIFPLCVESDAMGIVRLCNGVVGLCNDIDNIISDVFVLKTNYTYVSIVHTSRNCNRLAYSIARFAVFSGFSDVWHIDLPEWLSC